MSHTTCSHRHIGSRASSVSCHLITFKLAWRCLCRANTRTEGPTRSSGCWAPARGHAIHGAPRLLPTTTTRKKEENPKKLTARRVSLAFGSKTSALLLYLSAFSWVTVGKILVLSLLCRVKSNDTFPIHLRCSWSVINLNRFSWLVISVAPTPQVSCAFFDAILAWWSPTLAIPVQSFSAASFNVFIAGSPSCWRTVTL